MVKKYITTHKELLKLHGKKVTCKVAGKFIADARISVEDNKNQSIWVCCNTGNNGGAYIVKNFGYEDTLLISYTKSVYEKKQDCICEEIQLVEEEEKEEPEMMTLREAIIQNKPFKINGFYYETEASFASDYGVKYAFDHENKQVEIIKK